MGNAADLAGDRDERQANGGEAPSGRKPIEPASDYFAADLPRITTRVSPDLAKRLRQIACDCGTSVNAINERLLRSMADIYDDAAATHRSGAPSPAECVERLGRAQLSALRQAPTPGARRGRAPSLKPARAQGDAQ